MAIEPLFHETVMAQARMSPNALAVVGEECRWSYAELVGHAERVASGLAAAGVGPETMVGLCLERSAAAIAAVLGVLRSGGAFLPLDPSYPPERLRLMLTDARPAVVLVDAASRSALPPHSGRIIEVEAMLAGGQPGVSPVGPVGPETLAYVIYTSGSTGRPKGVMVEHRGLVNLARAQGRLLDIRSTSRVLQFASLNFDAAVAEIVVTLAAGASLHVAPRDCLMPIEPLARLMRTRAITHVTLPPSLLAALPTDALPEGIALILAGEPSTAALIARWAPSRQIWNAYGPTEATVCATLGACVADGTPPSIGWPIDRVEVLILDQLDEPVPIGMTGEIYIAGIGVARGYLGQPDLTAKRFVERLGRRAYRTGDLGRWRADGAIDFLGRADRQLKIRGYRVEPEEIEAALAAHPSVEAAAVIGCGEGPEALLVGYVVGAAGRRPSTTELHRHLAERLPAWMVPAAIVALDAFPMSPNGKIARELLPLPDDSGRGAASPFLGPRDTLELSLTIAFQEVLGLAQVGVRDDFFAAGGNSLGAARVAARLKATSGRNLPLSLFATNATVEGLALALRSTSVSARWSPVVPLATVGDAPPLILFHPAGGSVLAYADLVRALAGKLPVYGVQARGLELNQRPSERIEDFADTYVAALRDELTPSIWRLAGWSFGAVVAVEVARRLLAQGEQVAWPIVLDGPVRHAPGALDEADLVQRVIGMYGDMLQIDPALAQKGAASVNELVARAVASGIFPADFDGQRARRMAAMIAGCFRAGEAYEVKPADFGVTLIRASENPVRASDPLLGWRELATRGVDLRWTPGSHTSMLRPPAVTNLARIVLDCFETA